MKKVITYIAAILTMCSMVVLSSCHGQSDEQVPEGVLRIFADKTTISADGNDVVTFTVMFGSEDVSQARTLQLVRSADGVEKLMDYGVNSFSTVIPATYTFKAEFYRAGRYYSDNEVEVVALPMSGGGEVAEWKQRILGFQFTSIGCTNCPMLSSNIKAIQQEYPGRLSVVAFHQDFNGYTDEMTHPMTATYFKLLGTQGLPHFCSNLIVDRGYITVNEYDKIVAALDKTESEYPATCGVAVESELSGQQVNIKVKITSNTPTKYRYQIFLVEDGIESLQLGVSGDSSQNHYMHNNVVRSVVFDSVYGSYFNEGVNMMVGVEATAEQNVTIPSGCVAENMRIIVAAMSTYDNGNSYVVNNCADCPVGGSVDYEYNE